jgi:hypothetical protein
VSRRRLYVSPRDAARLRACKGVPVWRRRHDEALDTRSRRGAARRELDIQREKQVQEVKDVKIKISELKPLYKCARRRVGERRPDD